MRGMRNIRRKTSYDKAREILMQADYGILSTTCGDGLPYGIPLCFALSGNSIYFHCATEGQKLDNLVHDSRVCLTAVLHAENRPARLTMTYEAPWRSAQRASSTPRMSGTPPCASCAPNIPLI